jgi:hypothetical protein
MKGGKPPTVVMISTDYIDTYKSIYNVLKKMGSAMESVMQR